MLTRAVGWGVLSVLIVLNLLIAFGVLHRESKALTVAFLDVGQGDAIFITSPTGAQVLVDGGRDRSVLRELSRRMSPFDRTLDVIVETHPDADHIGGLPHVFKRYRIGAFISPHIENDTAQTHAVRAALQKETEAKDVLARRGMRVDIGGGAYIEVLFPDRDVSRIETNTGSVVMRLVYGDTEFMLTGDAPASIEEYLVSLDGTHLQSDVLKAGHHGSRTSTGKTFLEAVKPGIVVVSAGKDNSYGHPHEEVISRIEDSGAKVVSTTKESTIVFISDGTRIQVR